MGGQDRQEADFIPTLIYSFGRFKYLQNHFSLDKISSTTFLSYTFYREEKATQFTSSMAVVQFGCWCADVQMCRCTVREVGQKAMHHQLKPPCYPPLEVVVGGAEK